MHDHYLILVLPDHIPKAASPFPLLVFHMESIVPKDLPELPPPIHMCVLHRVCPPSGTAVDRWGPDPVPHLLVWNRSLPLDGPSRNLFVSRTTAPVWNGRLPSDGCQKLVYVCPTHTIHYAPAVIPLCPHLAHRPRSSRFPIECHASRPSFPPLVAHVLSAQESSGLRDVYA